ncbi:hypothetical protein Btru_025991 [Bulinus truncatus]|nr:hypothetical protein Btru_025991 [Bulinus truncatus]
MVNWELVEFDSSPLLQGITAEDIASYGHSQVVERNIKVTRTELKNFSAESYISMVNWELVEFDSSPLLQGITAEDIASYGHSQVVERNIKLSRTLAWLTGNWSSLIHLHCCRASLPKILPVTAIRKLLKETSSYTCTGDKNRIKKTFQLSRTLAWLTGNWSSLIHLHCCRASLPKILPVTAIRKLLKETSSYTCTGDKNRIKKTFQLSRTLAWLTGNWSSLIHLHCCRASLPKILPVTAIRKLLKETSSYTCTGDKNRIKKTFQLSRTLAWLTGNWSSLIHLHCCRASLPKILPVTAIRKLLKETSR